MYVLTQNARLLQQHDEAQRDGAHRDETQRAGRNSKDQARRPAHSAYSCCYYSYYYYYYSSLRVYRATSFTR